MHRFVSLFVFMNVLWHRGVIMRLGIVFHSPSCLWSVLRCQFSSVDCHVFLFDIPFCCGEITVFVIHAFVVRHVGDQYPPGKSCVGKKHRERGK